MAEGRMLKKIISKSRRLAELRSDSARLLYTWLLAHLDIEGRFSADPYVIKGIVFPRIKSITPTKISNWLNDIERNGLVIIYQIDDDVYLQYRKFKEYQSLRPDREPKSKIPAPEMEQSIDLIGNISTPGLTPGVTPGLTPAEDKISKDNINKEKYKKESETVLEYFNKKFKRNFRDASAIIARLKDGGTINQCKQIIDTKVHDPYFQKNPHLYRPETLFRKSHWDSYLNQKPSDFMSRDGPQPEPDYRTILQKKGIKP